MKKKLIKNKCEIKDCCITDSELLELHHIIPRTEEGSSHKSYNLAILCPNHHAMVHSGMINIIGIVNSTNPPNGRTLVYEINGLRNIPKDIPIFTPKNEYMKIIGA